MKKATDKQGNKIRYVTYDYIKKRANKKAFVDIDHIKNNFVVNLQIERILIKYDCLTDNAYIFLPCVTLTMDSSQILILDADNDLYVYNKIVFDKLYKID